jgi:hypothetical protein
VDLAGNVGRVTEMIAARLWGGSCIALATALLVVSARHMSGALEAVAWIIPAAIRIPLVHARPAPGRF